MIHRIGPPQQPSVRTPSVFGGAVPTEGTGARRDMPAGTPQPAGRALAGRIAVSQEAMKQKAMQQKAMQKTSTSNTDGEITIDTARTSDSVETGDRLADASVASQAEAVEGGFQQDAFLERDPVAQAGHVSAQLRAAAEGMWDEEIEWVDDAETCSGTEHADTEDAGTSSLEDDDYDDDFDDDFDDDLDDDEDDLDDDEDDDDEDDDDDFDDEDDDEDLDDEDDDDFDDWDDDDVDDWD